MSPETEAALELVDADTTSVAFMLQHAKRGQATHDVMLLSPLGARLTAGQAEVILAYSNALFDLGTDAIQSAHLRRCSACLSKPCES